MSCKAIHVIEIVGPAGKLPRDQAIALTDLYCNSHGVTVLS